MNGFLKIYRSMLSREWWQDIPTFRLFMTCLMLVNYKPYKYKGKEYKEGTFVTSLSKLSEASCLSIQQVRTSLAKLESTQELTSITTNKNRLIIVNNWAKYQYCDDDVNKVENKQITNKQQTNNKHYIEEEIKKERNNIYKYKNKEINIREDIIPTYDASNNPELDLERFKELLTRRKLEHN